MKSSKVLFPAVLLAFSTLHAQSLVRPGEPWTDTAGHRIQAHGGGVLEDHRAWYWFGEDYAARQSGARVVHCYRSTDLATWKDCGHALELAEPDELKAKYGTDWVLERPKVFRIHATAQHPEKFVMWFHLDAGNYKAARMGVAESARIEGPYTFVRSFQPFGQESRDIGQFVEDDGTNYVLFESRPTGGFYIAQLSADGKDVTGTPVFLHTQLEGNALVHTGGIYYVIGSSLSGWNPNPNVYATATSLHGPWSSFRPIAPPEKNTYGGQSAFLLKVPHPHRQDTVIFVGDIWREHDLPDSRYLWMPLTIHGNELILPEPRPWQINQDGVTLPQP